MELHFNMLLLAMYVVNLGIAFGAGLYETRITLPLWFGDKSKTGLHINKDVIVKMDVGRQFWAFVTTIPLTLLTIASLIAVFQWHGKAKEWWLASILIILVERFGTFFYFIPTAIKMTKPETLSEGQAAAMASQWIGMNRLRMTLNLAGWITALVAFHLASITGG